MVKKLALLVMAVAAVTALAAPAFASAAAEATEGAGNPIAVPATLRLTSGTNVFASNSLETETELGTLKCQQITLNGELTVNSGGRVFAHNGTGTTSGCTLEGEAFTVSEIEISEIEALSASGENKVALGFKISFFGGSLVCVWSGTGNFTYTSGSSEATLGATALTPNEEVCGPASIKGKLKLETTNGTAVQLM